MTFGITAFEFRKSERIEQKVAISIKVSEKIPQ
jgi:hypothetical protein